MQFPRKKKKKNLQQSQLLLFAGQQSATNRARCSVNQLLHESVTTETKAEEPIEDNYFRIHVKKLPETKDGQGLWTWDDVEKQLRKSIETEPCP